MFRSMILIITFYSTLGLTEELDGNPKYSIQVASENSYFRANAKLSEFREFDVPFVFEAKVLKKCNKKEKTSCEVEYENKYRVLLGVYSSKERAEHQLKEYKLKNSKKFKNAFIQNVIN